ncbi:IS3 family transposase [Micromonospora rubida]|uniref:IS3 family transposase n=1 Tax=Micromonospora rubida TaxID=2697657 RepID=UPI0038B2564C
MTVEQIAKDFGVHPMTLFKWLRQADVDAGTRPGVSGSESAELREARKRIRLLEQENEVLRRAAAYLSQANLPKRLYPLVSELAADGIPVAVTCRVLSIARQPYYRWLARPVGDAELVAAYRANALVDAHRDDPEFGYRFLVDEARHAGHPMADRTAWRICSGNGWWSAFGKKKRRGKGGKVGPPVHDDLVRRDFTAPRANQLWLADITEHHTAEGKLYLCAIKDVWSNRIVGYSIDSRMKSRLAVNALHNAVARRGRVAGCVLHTDRGSQFRSRKLIRALNQHHMIGSMGRVGAAGDNAAMESFFGLLQNNVLDRRTWTTRQQLRTAIVTWIERTYHRRRRQRSLSRLTPIEYETIMTPPASQAA